MTDARALLERHRPRLVYDSQEAYFASHAAIWTDSPTNVLRRAGGTVAPPRLNLGFLGPHTYADGRRVLAADTIGDTTRTYAANAKALPHYRDIVHGHARRDRHGRLWLQYWLFYYYNDFRLLGDLFSAGKHEGDWELVHLRLDASGKPDLAVFTQHRTAERRPWADVRKAGDAPLVYVARGSHANYFRPGLHATGAWFDQADGRGPQIRPELDVVEDTTPWMLWPGRWGDTKATSSPIDSNSPTSPGRRAHWLDPAALAATAGRELPAPPGPRVTVRRAGVIAYEAPPDATALVVATRRAGEPATVRALPLDTPSGELDVDDGEVWVSAVREDGVPSAGVSPYCASPPRSP